MRHEKIIKRSDGTRVKVVASLSDCFRREYNTSVYTCAKGKRTWVNVTNSNDWHYRQLSRDEKTNLDYENQLAVVSVDEIHDAKIDLWNKIKPIKEKR